MRGFFLLITYSRPLRLTIWQSFVRRLIDAATFMFNLLNATDDPN
jgi:hypothetical protein